MKHLRLCFTIMLAFCLSVSGLLTAPQAHAAVNDYVTVSKTVNPTTITTEQEAEVNLNLLGTPPINVIVPNDVVLIIDKSGSMRPEYNNGEDKMTNAKEAAKGFIDLMDMTKHRVAVVDFSSTNSIGSFPFTTDKDAAKNYINGISANGSTATGDSIVTAMNLLADHRPEAQPVIVIMTDGEATQPSNDPFGYAKQKASEAKDAGIILYTIALLRATDNPDTSGPNVLLKEMATTASHHHFVLGSTGLSEIYAAIVREIGMASAYDVTVSDIVDPNFEIVPGSYDNNIPKPSVSGNTLTWTFNELKNSTLLFTYKIRPVSKTKTGIFPVSTAASQITYKDYAGASRSKAIPSVNVTVKLPAPEITSIVQPTGHPKGGETVAINGKNFVTGATVQFGFTNATNVIVVNDIQITATVPSGKQGMVTVTVINPDGQKATGQYQYKTDPIITSLVPNNGPLEGGNTVVINGDYLMQGVEVKFGDKIANLVSHASEIYMKVTAPSNSVAGAVYVTFKNPDGTQVTVIDGYTYNAPPVDKFEITTVSPNKGAIAGGDVVYIDGKKIAPTAKVLFGSQEVGISTYYSESRVKVVSPPSLQAGTVDVSLRNPDGEISTLTSAYTYEAPPELPAPTVTALTPANGPLAGSNTVYIDGTNFVNGVQIYIGGKQATVNNFYSATRLKATIPAGDTQGIVDVKAVNPDSKEGILVGGYTYDAPPALPAPNLTQITPASGQLSGGEILYIDGTGFQSGLKVFIGSNEATLLTYYNSTRLKVSAPAAVAGGKVDVRIVNPDGKEAILASGYEYLVPVPKPIIVTSITPNSGLTLGGEIIVITGTNFKSGAQVKIGASTVNLYAFDSDIRIRVIAPSSATVGSVDVTVTNPDGMTYTVPGGYTYQLVTPTITLISPNHGPKAGGTILYVDGTNFEANMTVTINGIAVPISTFYNSTRIKLTAPASAVVGSVPFVITLANGQSVANTYTYDAPPAVPAPNITLLSATSGNASGGYYLYIDGTGFQQGMTVNFGSNPGQIAMIYSSNRFKVLVPAGSIGPVNIKIVNPDGQQSNLVVFTYN